MAYAEILFLRIWVNENRNGHWTIAITSRTIIISSRRALFLGTGYCYNSTFGVGIKFPVHFGNPPI